MNFLGKWSHEFWLLQCKTNRNVSLKSIFLFQHYFTRVLQNFFNNKLQHILNLWKLKWLRCRVWSCSSNFCTFYLFQNYVAGSVIVTLIFSDDYYFLLILFITMQRIWIVLVLFFLTIQRLWSKLRRCLFTIQRTWIVLVFFFSWKMFSHLFGRLWAFEMEQTGKGRGHKVARVTLSWLSESLSCLTCCSSWKQPKSRWKCYICCFWAQKKAKFWYFFKFRCELGYFKSWSSLYGYYAMLNVFLC